MNVCRFYSLINTLISYNGGCSFEGLPIVSFVFGDEKYTLEPEDYLHANGESECTLGLFPVDIEPPKGPLFILGTSFFKRYYTIFDLENNRVGFSRMGSTKEEKTGDDGEVYETIWDSWSDAQLQPQRSSRLGSWRRL